MSPSPASRRDLAPTPPPASLLPGVPSAPPAVDDNGPGVRRGGGLHAPDEGQQPRGVVGDAVLRPRREVELADLVPGRVASLGDNSKHSESLLESTRPLLCARRRAVHLTAGSQLIPIINLGIGVTVPCTSEKTRAQTRNPLPTVHYAGLGPRSA